MKFPITKVLNCRNSKTQKKLSNILKQKAGNGEVHQISVSIKGKEFVLLAFVIGELNFYLVLD